MEETRFFFDQRLGPNDFTNRGPRIFPTADLGGLIKDIRQNKLLDSFTMPRQWNNRDSLKTWATHHGSIQGGGGYASKWIFFGCRPKSNGSRPLLNTGKKGNKRSKPTREGTSGKKYRTPPSSAHQIYGKVPEKYATHYFVKLLIAGNKTMRDLPKYGGNLHSTRDMCMHHIMEKCMNPNYSFYYAQAK